MNKISRWFGAGLMMFFAPHPQMSAGGLPIGLPSQEWTQILVKVQLAMQYERQAQQIANQLQMIRMEVQNGLHLIEHPMVGSAVLADIAGLRTLIRDSQGLAYGFAANDAAFRATYGSYAQSTQPFSNRYMDRAAATLNIALGAARAAGLAQDQVWSEQSVNQHIQSLMATPAGANQSLEIANSLALGEVGQLQKLRALIASDMQSKAAFTGYQISKDQAKESDTSAATAYVEREADHRQFGFVPGVR